MYKNQLQSNSYQTTVNINLPQQKFPNQAVILPDEKKMPFLLTDCMAIYIAYLNNVDVPAHEVKFRKEETIKEVERYFVVFIDAMLWKGVDVEILNFTDITDKLVGFSYDYVLNHKTKIKDTVANKDTYSPRTFNKFFGALRSFVNHVIENYNFNMRNPFNKVKQKKVKEDPKKIEPNEFEDLLKIITPQNGIQVLSSGERKNHYKEWLSDAFLLGVFTRWRRDLVVNAKWKDVQIKNGEPHVILFDNKKYNDSYDLKGIEREIESLSVHDELKDFLIRKGFFFNKGSDKYILAPEEAYTRKTIKNKMSKAFTHYYKQLNTGNKLQFKNLRKTFMTAGSDQFGENFIHNTGHKNYSTILKSYRDKSSLVEKHKVHILFS